MIATKSQAGSFTRLMKLHAAEMAALARAFDNAVEVLSQEGLAAALKSEKVAN